MHCSPKWARRGLLSTSTLSFNVMSVLNSASCGMFYSGSLPYSKWVRRQRAFLQSDGRWTSHEAGERRPFLCVEKIEECELGENREGNWLFRDGEDYQNIPSETTAMPKGTILHLRCSTSWNRRTDQSFKCIQGNASAYWVKCSNKNCGRFNRYKRISADVFQSFTC